MLVTLAGYMAKRLGLLVLLLFVSRAQASIKYNPETLELVAAYQNTSGIQLLVFYGNSVTRYLTGEGVPSAMNSIFLGYDQKYHQLETTHFDIGFSDRIQLSKWQYADARVPKGQDAAIIEGDKIKIKYNDLAETFELLPESEVEKIQNYIHSHRESIVWLEPTKVVLRAFKRSGIDIYLLLAEPEDDLGTISIQLFAGGPGAMKNVYFKGYVRDENNWSFRLSNGGEIFLASPDSGSAELMRSFITDTEKKSRIYFDEVDVASLRGVDFGLRLRGFGHLLPMTPLDLLLRSPEKVKQMLQSSQTVFPHSDSCSAIF